MYIFYIIFNRRDYNIPSYVSSFLSYHQPIVFIRVATHLRDLRHQKLGLISSQNFLTSTETVTSDVVPKHPSRDYTMLYERAPKTSLA